MCYLHGPVAHDRAELQSRARGTPHACLQLPWPPRCRFTVQVPAWAPGWLATARLRFSAPPPSPQATPDPHASEPAKRSVASAPAPSMASEAAADVVERPPAHPAPLAVATSSTASSSKLLSQEMKVPSAAGFGTPGVGEGVAGLRNQEGRLKSGRQQGEVSSEQQDQEQEQQQSREPRPLPTHSGCQSACPHKCGALPQGEGCDLVPFFTIPLWSGGRFDAGYNARQQELQVRLVAL